MRRTLALLLVFTIILSLTSATCAQDAKTFYDQGDSFQKDGKYAEAITAYTKAIGIDPNLVNAYVQRGQCKRKLNPPDYTGSLGDFNKAIEINPKSVLAYNGRGITYKEMNYLKTALSDFDKAIEINPSFSKPYYNRGSLKEALGEHADALTDLNKAIKLDPSNIWSYVMRAEIKKSLKDFAGARADYEKVLSLDPKNDKAKSGLSSLGTTAKQQPAVSGQQSASSHASDGSTEALAKTGSQQPAVSHTSGGRSASPSGASTSSAGIKSGSQSPGGDFSTDASTPQVKVEYLPDKPDDQSLWNRADTPWRKGDTPITREDQWIMLKRK